MEFRQNIEKLTTNRLSIPRFGTLQKTESLNVATATAIILSEFRRLFIKLKTSTTFNEK